MLQTILTALAGIAIGIAIMRLWQPGRSGATPTAEDAARDTARDDPAPEASAGIAANAKRPSTRALLIGAGGLAVVALVLIVVRAPSVDAPAGASLATPAASGAAESLDDVDTMISRLADRLAKDPTDGAGFRMLGWSHVMTGHPERAIEPYKKALALLPKDAAVHAGYGEALTGVAKGRVTGEARAQFERALSLDPTEPRSRYFMGLWQAQNGQERQALDAWIALANSGPADAPWQADVRKHIDETAKKLGVDVSGRLKQASPATGPALSGAEPPPIPPSAMQAANALPDEDRQRMIDGMVEGLAKKLAANPRDADGWVRLLRSRMVLGQRDQAVRDLAVARKALAADGAALGKVNAAAVQFGVTGA